MRPRTLVQALTGAPRARRSSATVSHPRSQHQCSEVLAPPNKRMMNQLPKLCTQLTHRMAAWAQHSSTSLQLPTYVLLAPSTSSHHFDHTHQYPELEHCGTARRVYITLHNDRPNIMPQDDSTKTRAAFGRSNQRFLPRGTQVRGCCEGFAVAEPIYGCQGKKRDRQYLPQASDDEDEAPAAKSALAAST